MITSVSSSRQCQLAAESDRRRLLRRCLNEWQLWCRTEKEQRELLARQQEIKQKMAALISAASAGKLKATESPAYRTIMAPLEAPNQTTEKVRLTNPHVISNGAFSSLMIPTEHNLKNITGSEIMTKTSALIGGAESLITEAITEFWSLTE